MSAETAGILIAIALPLILLAAVAVGLIVLRWALR
jgi:hypothetical protein